MIMITRVFELYERSGLDGETHVFELDDDGTVIWSAGYHGIYASAHALLDVNKILAKGISPHAAHWGRGTHSEKSKPYEVYIKTRIRYNGICAVRWRVRTDGYITVEYGR